MTGNITKKIVLAVMMLSFVTVLLVLPGWEENHNAALGADIGNSFLNWAYLPLLDLPQHSWLFSCNFDFMASVFFPSSYVLACFGGL